jgi:hypothetical protein
VGLPVPRDVVALVLDVLRPAFAERSEPYAAGLVVSSEMGSEPGNDADDGPPSLPWLLVAEDGHSWSWPAVQRSTIRLTCWHRSEFTAKAVCALALGLLCAPGIRTAPITADPITAPIAGLDPYTDQPLATASVAVFARTPLL